MSSVQVRAAHHAYSLRGRCQSKLLRTSDGQLYIVKFSNNPHGPRILVRELFATRLAQRIGLPVASPAIVCVSEELVAHEPALTIDRAGRKVPCEPGRHFGSQYVVNPSAGRVFDLVPREMLCRVRDREAFAGMLAFDTWTANCDWRQAVLWRHSGDEKYSLAFVDFGSCFSSGDWRFADVSYGGLHPSLEVYANVRGWRDFDPFIDRIEQMEEAEIWKCSCGIPPEWSEGNENCLRSIVGGLYKRRATVRDSILKLRDSSLKPFPLWVGD